MTKNQLHNNKFSEKYGNFFLSFCFEMHWAIDKHIWF